MTSYDPKADLRYYLRRAREAMLWKLDGLSEFDARRPLTPTGTNLLGLIKHLAGVEAGYFGATFGRPFGEPMPWDEHDEDHTVDLWARADESRAEIVGLYQRVCAHADATINALALDAAGRVPWWGADGDVTLHLVLVHVIAETDRHAGHADIVRELIDGSVGLRSDNANMATADAAWWQQHVNRVEQAARQAAGQA